MLLSGFRLVDVGGDVLYFKSRYEIIFLHEIMPDDQML